MIYIPIKIYVANGHSNTVSVIDGSNRTGVPDRKEQLDITVGRSPHSISFNGETHMIYVGNTGSHSVSVINGFTSKVAAGVKFNVNPSNSGTVMCDKKDDKKEYPTNTYIYVYIGTRCTGQANNNFQFDRWIQNLDHNSSLPSDEPSGILTVNRYGNFTANFKPIPPPIPPQYLYLVISVIVSSMIGWSIPSIMGWVKARTQRKYLKICINQIGTLNRNDIEEMITGYFVDGKISDSHRELLKDKISEHYEKIKDS